MKIKIALAFTFATFVVLATTISSVSKETYKPTKPTINSCAQFTCHASHFSDTTGTLKTCPVYSNWK